MNFKLIYDKPIYYFLVLMLIILTGFISCNKNETGENVVEPKAEITVNPDKLSVPNKPGEQTLKLISNVSWTAAADVPWITIHTEKGKDGTNEFIFTVPVNYDSTKKTGIITISPAVGKPSKTITVTQKAGPPDGVGSRKNLYVKPDGLGDGSSWNHASDLDYALLNGIEGTVIHLAAGTYVPTKTITGGDLSQSYDITFEINKNMTLIGGYPANILDTLSPPDPAVNKTILSGSLPNGSADHVVAISAPQESGEKVVLNGLIITEGDADGPSNIPLNGTKFYRNNGGGVIIGNAVAKINNCEMIDNKAGHSAGGLFVIGEDAKVTISNSKINNNTAKGSVGGVWVYSGAEVTFYNSEVNNNSAIGVAGGIYVQISGTLTMYNSTVANNKGTSFGAGIYLRGDSKGTFVNCLLTGNETTSSHGGGALFMYDNSDAAIISSTITQNDASKGPGGGVLRTKNTNNLYIYNSIISGNKQKSGSDVDAGGSGDFVVVASVTGSKAYDANGSLLTGSTFDANAMLNAQFVPVGSKNPALTKGLDAQALSNLNSSLTPSLDDDIKSDLNGNSRAGKTIMGAKVQ